MTHRSEFEKDYYDLEGAELELSKAQQRLEQVRKQVTDLRGAEIVAQWTEEDWNATNVGLQKKAVARAQERLDDVRQHLVIYSPP